MSGDHPATMPGDGPAEPSAVKRALVELRRLKARLAEYEARDNEPIAIVGIGLRTPGGVRDLRDLERQLYAGEDAISEVPADRWSLADWYDESADSPGKMTTRFGGFIDSVDRFDAGFFGISPLEAASMDPQQRLVLELAWEALENAGHAPSSLAGSLTGVYLGIANGDYGRSIFSRAEDIDAYFSSGNSYGVASGRLAYLLDLRGPALSIDTACSSSLVAVHLACQGLRSGECEQAIAGGVNLILGPELNVNFSKAGMMARDGRCKTFDAAADGYVRGEGGVILLLRRLRDARADGDRVLAVIRGSAMNQDGRSNGLTAPNGPAQEAVLRKALEAAAVRPEEVGYVEAHGTGTSLGDPIEVNALAAVFAEGHDASRPLCIGSIKTNIGHLEAAAGAAGIAKTIVALGRGDIPPHLHLAEPNPLIDWDAMPLRVPTAVTPWPIDSGRRLAGVSSFGFSGTNAHLVLEAAPPPEPRARDGQPRDHHLLTLSARDATALGQLVSRYLPILESEQLDDEQLGDVCFSANAGRNAFRHRVAVSGRTSAELAGALDACRRSEQHPRLARGEAGDEPPRVALIFPGQGPQYAGMGKRLYETAPAFRAAFDECAAILDELLDRPLRGIVLADDGDASLLDRTIYAQPAMFAIEYALARLWLSWGLKPAGVMGHSFGEYAAACIAGALPLAEAARMVATRGRLAQALPDDGAMMVVEVSAREVSQAIAEYGRSVAIAAVNGPANTVISGERAQVRDMAAKFAGQGARTKALRVSHAFHSPLIEPVLEDFAREIDVSTVREPRIPIYSTLTGAAAGARALGSKQYWCDQLREPVRFTDAIRAMAGQGITHFVEPSPHPVLLGMGAECVDDKAWLASLREGQPAWQTMSEAVQMLFCDGVDFDWQGFDRGMGRRRVPLPTYPFNRTRHWVEHAGEAEKLKAANTDRWQQVAAVMAQQSARGPLDLNAGSYPDKWDCLGRLTLAHARSVLLESGLFARAGESQTADSVQELAGILPTYRMILRRWLDGLVGQGLLRREGERYIAEAPLQPPDLATLWQEAEQRFADNRPMFDYVRHCASLLGQVVRGRESPLETLFPGGSFELARGLYERSATMLYINALASAGLRALADSSPTGQLRLLEIGGGTGGTTSALLSALSPGRYDYLFTDVSEAFLAPARSRFADHAQVAFGLFDLDRELDEQGYEPGSFDVIVAANAVHAVKDLRGALRRLLALAAPGGAVLLVESTTHLDYFDMTTGLIEGWQHFADDLRGDNPLLAPSTWIDAFETAGFARAAAWPPENSIAEAMGQHVIVAFAPGEPVPHRVVAQVSGAAGDAAPQPADADQQPGPTWRERLQDGMPAERLDLLRELVRAQVMAVMRLDPDSPPSRHDRLMELGMDSLMAVQLRNALTQELALQSALPATLMFDYPTIEAIASRLVEIIGSDEEPAGQEQPPAEPAEASGSLDEADVAAMSDAEIERLIDQRLEGS